MTGLLFCLALVWLVRSLTRTYRSPMVEQRFSKDALRDCAKIAARALQRSQS